MKPTTTLEDYQKLEKFLISYIESQIIKLEDSVWMCDGDQGRRKAYKDILFKLTNNR